MSPSPKRAPNELAQKLLDQISSFDQATSERQTGRVIEVGDGIARVAGLRDVRSMELLRFKQGAVGVALNLERDVVGAMLLSGLETVVANEEVEASGELLGLPVGDVLLGRVIDPLGRALDGRGAIKSKTQYPVEKVAANVMAREPVTVPLMTGIKAIDSMIPIGRGQRELIIGDRQVGKTAIAIDTIVNQKGQGVTCVYVAIGQKASKVAKLVAKLEAAGAMEYTTVVVANASDPASLQFIAPYAGSAICEYVMDQGRDALVVYDDLSKHAWAYREISLLLKRPPGREAYPGDVFYLHSRLLERAVRLKKEHGGGSITALPIIETQAGDVSAYIPTNVISITDGQIYLESDLFYRGIRPALNVGLSVSRVGGAAQTKAMKKVAGPLRLDLAQFRELEAFAQFSSDVDAATKQQIERGRRLVELLKQGELEPLSMELQVAILYAAVKGFLDAIPADKIADWERGYKKQVEIKHKKMLERLREEKKLDDALEASLKASIEEWNRSFTQA